MPIKQHTIGKPVSVSGIGLHTGKPVTLTFHPAPDNHGFIFRRTDLEGNPEVPADVSLVVDTSRGTTLGKNNVNVHTVEHVLAALAGLEFDNILIDLDGPEPPAMDGSAAKFAEALMQAGRVTQESPREYFEIEEAVHLVEEDRKVELAVLPAHSFRATVMIDFDSETLKPQHATLDSMKSFGETVADSRTFCFLHELESLHAAGLIQGGSLDNAVVVAEKPIEAEHLARLHTLFGREDIQPEPGVLNPEGFRHDNEPARHKLLDLVGDLALIGMPIKGHILATRPGHKANVELAKKIKAQIKQRKIARRFQKEEKKGVVFDINAIQEILPHRYPFLLVDKIVDFGENTITGVKNVTMNEPFFQGHFPGNPIMPGVLQLEAMGQVGGILLLNTIDNPQSIWVYFVAIDNVRFKKPVIPGDTLVLELELTALKRSICKMTGKGYVDGQLVCSADLVASVVPKNKL
ncbi:MAG: bifunctional UDP-3-O-[3-hydroxymyristoyl] N-acetylglucosamine deacetylase/3-hydroxyacyl-ACP dehydratase [Bacteroidetes bacterium]|nr:MAG: bifunctional UDP-3-O-[3-hydroxymyristoyl] N-acetylglucosamine deacetylase/3-hydroxyacyl-ACP dehydratase [Bacteroidota bacterium]